VVTINASVANIGPPSPDGLPAAACALTRRIGVGGGLLLRPLRLLRLPNGGLVGAHGNDLALLVEGNG
jgi:hypothetical protein